MGVSGDLYCGMCGRQITPALDAPLHCSECGRPIGPAEALRSRWEHDRYLCLECMEAVRIAEGDA